MEGALRGLFLVDRAIKDTFENLVARVIGFEGEVVAEDDVAVRQFAYLREDIGQIIKVVLVDLNNPQARIRVLVEQSSHN